MVKLIRFSRFLFQENILASQEREKLFYNRGAEKILASPTACRDIDHDKVAVIFSVVSEANVSTRPKKHTWFPNKQRGEIKMFCSNGSHN